MQAKLADPQFYARDRAGFEKVTTDLGETQRKLAAAEEQWLELEILREEIAGGMTGTSKSAIEQFVDRNKSAELVSGGNCNR